MRIVVTGATGNVAFRLLPELLARPEVDTVVGIARRLPAEADPRVEWHSLDVAEDDLGPAFRDADVVVHLAWLLQPSHDPDEMRRVNLGGTRRVLDAFVAAGAPALVHASSIGAYSPGPKDHRVDETHPTDGIATSTYSRHKAEAERMLDRLEAAHPERRVVRMRKGIVLQPDAASALARYFLGPLVPQSLVRRGLVPVVPAVDRLAIQALHAEDAASAYVEACLRPVEGAFNLAAEPVLDPPTLARLLGARTVPLPAAALRAAVAASWRLHLQPTDPGWVDIGRYGPLMDCGRAASLLGWAPRHDAGQALVDTLDAMGAGRGAGTPVLRPRAGGAERLGEVVRGLAPGLR
ncbi:MAG TPA: NAD-dependent epimerase/dehydratase family protein [Mycobacteriales bacterium]|nr:NAD-dependent epimerase/dehydratase family protein [Mycobacteriales bacterium]